jgi:Ribbon-helix-helix protein, copG family
MSRPRKPAGAHLVITQIRIPGPLKRRLEALSAATGYAQQEHMRRAIDEYVTKHEERGVVPPPPEVAIAPTRRVFKRPAGLTA